MVVTFKKRKNTTSSSLPFGTAVGSAVGGGTIRTGIGGSTYVDPSTPSKVSAAQTSIITTVKRPTSSGGGSSSSNNLMSVASPTVVSPTGGSSQSQQTVKPTLSTAQLQAASKNFSGKVEVFDRKGKPSDTIYYNQGEEIARTKRKRASHGGNITVAEVKPSANTKLTFGNQNEVVEVNGMKGITTFGYSPIPTNNIISPTSSQEKSYYVLEPELKIDKRVSNLFGVNEYLFKKRLSLETSQARSPSVLKGFGISALTLGVSLSNIGNSGSNFLFNDFSTILRPTITKINKENVKKGISYLSELNKPVYYKLDKKVMAVKTVGQIFGTQLRNNPERVVGEASSLYVQGKSLSLISNYLKKPITIKISPKIENYASIGSSAVIKKGEVQKNIGAFAVISTNAPRVAYQVPMGELLSKKIVGLGVGGSTKKSAYSRLSFNQLDNYFRFGKVVEYSKGTSVISVTEPFVINTKGQIKEPVRTSGPRVVGVDITKISGSGRISNYVSKLEGFTYPEAFNVNLAKSQFSPIQKKAFEKIDFLGGNKEIKIFQKFPKDATLSIGEIKTTDLFKLNSKGEFKPMKVGKTINRGVLIGVRNKIGNIEYNREFGLKEQTFYKERIGFADLTLPKVRQVKGNSVDILPKESILIEGISKESYIEFPSDTTNVQFLQTSGKKSSKGYLQGMYKQTTKQKTIPLNIKKDIISIAKTNTRLHQTFPIKYTPSLFVSSSKYAGAGLYERTEGGQLPPITRVNYKMQVKGSNEFKMNNIETSKSISLVIPKLSSREVSRFNQRPLQRTIHRNITTPLEKTLERTMQRTAQRTVQRTQLRLTKRTIQRTIIKTPNLVPKSIPILTPRGILKFNIKGNNKQFNGRKGFSVFVRRFGVFKPVGRTRSVKEAFQLGKFKTYTTLGATFKVEGTNNQPQNIFGYKTKKTPKGIYYIEEPKFRLSTPTETKEINYFKRLKGGRL